MTYVITEPCVANCDQACVKVCPMDCIHGPIANDELALLGPAERARRLPTVQLFIDPALCIECGACEPECPVEAIFPEDEVPAAWAHYRERNARFFRE